MSSAEHPASNLSSLPYRPGVGMLLFNHAGLVFVGRRIDQTAESWQMPQGGIDPGEAPEATAIRELAEEVGTDKVRIEAESRDWLIYDLPPALIGRVWHGRYRGQRQKWFAMRFLGEDSDINVATAHPEFDAWRWARADEMMRLIIPFKRALYEQVVAEFRHLLA